MMTCNVAEKYTMGSASWPEWQPEAAGAFNNWAQAALADVGTLPLNPYGAVWSPEAFQAKKKPSKAPWSLRADAEPWPGSDKWEEAKEAEELLSQTWSQDPQKLDLSAEVDKKPFSSKKMHSPMNVPLPTPVLAGENELADLPPGLDTPWEMTLTELPSLSSSTAATTATPSSTPLGPSLLNGLPMGGLELLRPQGGSPVADGEPLPQGITKCEALVGTRIQWQIDDFCAKFVGAPSRPLVSPPFSACGLPNLRLMVLPAARDASKASAKNQKGAVKKGATKKGASGPIFGGLKLKADCLEGATTMTFSLCVGSSRLGPFTYDFSQQAVHGPNDFGLDWAEQTDQVTACLRVAVEIEEVKRK